MKVFVPVISVPRSLYLSILFLVAVVFVKAVIDFEQDYDLWLHLFFGGEILTNHAIPRVDVYSFTATGSPIFNHEWLSQVVFYLLYQCLGDLGLIGLRALFYAGVLLILFTLLRARVNNKFCVGVILLLLISVLKPGIAFRIQMFSYLLAALIVFLEESSVDERLRFVVYPLLFALWANLHGAFVLGVAILSIYTLDFLFCREGRLLQTGGRAFRIKAVLVVLSVAATLVNPYGLDLWTYVFHEVTTGRSSEYITEWQRFGFEPRERAFFVLWVVSCLSGLLTLKKQRISSLLLLVLGSYLGFSAVRHTPLLAILALPTLLNAFSGTFQGETRENLMSCIAATLIMLLSMGLLGLSSPAGLKITAIRDPLPKEVVDDMESKQLQGKMFVPLHWGGYALYRLYPDIKVSIDGRWATTYPEQVMDLNMRFYSIDSAEKMLRLAETYDAKYILFERGHPEIANILAYEYWTKLSEGENAVLVGRR